MEPHQRSTDSRESFDGRYAGGLPSIREGSSEHERFLHQSTMAALSCKSYAHAFEPGCSTGELTAQLARVCDRVSATDISLSAVARARVLWRVGWPGAVNSWPCIG